MPEIYPLCYAIPMKSKAAKTGFDRYFSARMKDRAFASDHREARKGIDSVDAFMRSLEEARTTSGVSKTKLAQLTGTQPAAMRRLFTIWGVAGASNYCWPDNLGGVFDGTTHTDSSGLGLTSSGTAVGTSGGAGANGTAGGQGKVARDAGMASAPATQPTPPSSKSGCTIAGRSGASVHFALLALHWSDCSVWAAPHGRSSVASASPGRRTSPSWAPAPPPW